MAFEIERKFLVEGDSYRSSASSRSDIIQGYIDRSPRHTVRVRLADGRGFLTVKGLNEGAVRKEFEYEIPASDARELLSLCEGKVISKTRYRILFAGLHWEVDEFHGADEGLIVAEVELPAADTPVELPPFAGKEVTGDPRYYNSML